MPQRLNLLARVDGNTNAAHGNEMVAAKDMLETVSVGAAKTDRKTVVKFSDGGVS